MLDLARRTQGGEATGTPTHPEEESLSKNSGLNLVRVFGAPLTVFVALIAVSRASLRPPL